MILICTGFIINNTKVNMVYLSYCKIGVIVLNEAAAFLLEEMKHEITIDDLLLKLVSNYDVDESKARDDIIKMVGSLNELGLIE